MYTPPAQRAALVETMPFGHVRRLNRGRMQRADFHVVAVVAGGTGEVTIDFARHELRPRSAVWIPPGAVHRWDDIASLRGDVVLFVPTAPVTPGIRQLAATPGLGGCWPVPADEWRLTRAAVAHLRLEAGAAATSSEEVTPILLTALLARLRPPRTSAPDGMPIFRAFQLAVEADFRAHHDVDHYARTLGYAPRTLTRATLAATGVTAKSYVTERLVLEARRMLAHDRATVSRCASELGFVDASHFSAAFRRATGERPLAWRKRVTPGRDGRGSG